MRTTPTSRSSLCFLACRPITDPRVQQQPPSPHEGSGLLELLGLPEQHGPRQWRVPDLRSKYKREDCWDGLYMGWTHSDKSKPLLCWHVGNIYTLYSTLVHGILPSKRLPGELTRTCPRTRIEVSSETGQVITGGQNGVYVLQIRIRKEKPEVYAVKRRSTGFVRPGEGMI